MEQGLKKQFPFLEVKEEVIPRYRFASTEVNERDIKQFGTAWDRLTQNIG